MSDFYRIESFVPLIMVFYAVTAKLKYFPGISTIPLGFSKHHRQRKYFGGSKTEEVACCT